MATAAAHADDPLTIGGRAVAREDAHRRPRRAPGRPAGRRPRDAAAFRSASTAACASASCCIRSATPRSTSKGRRRARPCSPASITGRGPSSTPWNAWPAATAPNATAPAGPGDRRGPAPRLPGPPRRALSPRRLPGRTDRPARPAQGRPVRRPPEPGVESLPTVAELAERIKALKAAQPSRPRRSGSAGAGPPPRSPSPPASATAPRGKRNRPLQSPQRRRTHRPRFLKPAPSRRPGRTRRASWRTGPARGRRRPRPGSGNASCFEHFAGRPGRCKAFCFNHDLISTDSRFSVSFFRLPTPFRCARTEFLLKEP